MRILIAPNAFKGSITAQTAATCIDKGLKAGGHGHQTTVCPIADGGDDTLDLLASFTDARLLSCTVQDPLDRKIQAQYGWTEDQQKAIIGVSNASGLHLLDNAGLDPLRATSFGTGELLTAALEKGARELIIAVGGSATVDGATGLLQAMGLQLSDKSGKSFFVRPENLTLVNNIHTYQLQQLLQNCKITVLCDVKNKLLGPKGAAAVYGPQKGAGQKEVLLLEQALYHWNALTFKNLGFDMSGLPGGGAGGGIAAGLAAYTGAQLVNGIDYFLQTVQFERRLREADLLITAEGSIDDQTLSGKGPMGVALRAKKLGKRVIGLAGKIPDAMNAKMAACFDELICINPPGTPIAEAMANAKASLVKTAFELGNRLAG